MPAAIIARTDAAFTIQVEIPYGSSMLDFEEVILQRLNEAGVLATQEALRRLVCLPERPRRGIGPRPPRRGPGPLRA